MTNHTFNPGDHLKSHRGTYWHHGIYEGWGRVIDLTGDARKEWQTAEVRRRSLEDFCAGNGAEVVPYSGARPTHEVLENARSRIGQKGYSLLNWNCEHFAVWCKTNRAESFQVNVALQTALVLLIAWAVLAD